MHFGETDMDKKKLVRTAQSVLCVIIAVMLITAALGICREGLALKAADPLNRIYTREKAAAALRPVLPLFVISVVLTVIGLIAGIREEHEEKTVHKETGMAKGQRSFEKNDAKPVRLRALRAVLFLLAAGLIAAGALNGSARDVFSKAVQICSECIGLG